MRKATGMMMVLLISFVLGTAGSAFAGPPADDPEHPRNVNRVHGVDMACGNAGDKVGDNPNMENSVFGSCQNDDSNNTSGSTDNTEETDGTDTTLNCEDPNVMINNPEECPGF